MIEKTHVYKVVDSPVGKLTLVADDTALTAILWENDEPRRVRLGRLVCDESHRALTEVERQLNEYFSGRRTDFTTELHMVGTDFQKKVWNVLLAIPHGATRTYGNIAKELGNANGSRAVGAAIGRNPISIIVPCHRVIGTNGSLTGFAGGLETKRYLLALERNDAPLLDLKTDARQRQHV